MIGRQLVRHDRAARRPDRMNMSAAADLWIHSLRRLDVRLVVAQKWLLAEAGFDRLVGIDDRDSRHISPARRLNGKTNSQQRKYQNRSHGVFSNSRHCNARG